MNFVTFLSLLLLPWTVGALYIPRDSSSGSLNTQAYNYASSKVRGVNLGSWFIVEQYMAPSLFQPLYGSQTPLDEWHLTQHLGRDQAQSTLENHWQTWINESDFQQIAQWGFNTVRIPIGYWAFVVRSNEPYVQGQLKYMDQAVQWARKHSLQVWIDLHGVPGSQNGFDNSGISGSINWQDTQTSNVNDTLTVLKIIKDRYGGPENYDVISGIELVNEPLGNSLSMQELKDYYHQGYEIIREGGENTVILHDAFQDLDYWNDVLDPSDYQNVVVDHHEYQVYTENDKQLTADEHIKAACDVGRSYGQVDTWQVTGEWSAALPVTNTQNTNQSSTQVSNWSEDQKTTTRKYIEAQMDAYDQGNGWIFWSYKTENTIVWDVRELINNNLFPQPLSDRQYPNQCGF